MRTYQSCLHHESGGPIVKTAATHCAWLVVPIVGLLMVGLAQSATAQGAFSLFSGATAGNSMNGIIFEIQAINTLTLYRVGNEGSTTGTLDFEIWTRPGGHNNGNPDGNWVQAGTTSVAMTSGVVTQIPVDINVVVTAGQVLGICIINTSPTNRIGYANGPFPDVSDANVTIHMSGFGKSYSPGFTPPVASNYAPRYFCGTIWYDQGVSISSPTPGALPDSTEGQTGYNATFECDGGNSPWNWSLTGAPPWLSFNPTAGATVELTAATVGAAGSYSFDVTVTDSGGNDDTETYTLLVLPPPFLSGPATLEPLTETGSWPVPISFTATGGATPYTFTLTGAPPGVTLSATGDLQGPPDAGTATGSPYSVSVTVEDANGVSDTVGPLSLVVNEPPMITTPALPDGAVGISYSETVATAGGTLPFSWSLTGTVGPFSIDAATGEITGMPGVVGTFDFDVEVVDACGVTATASLSILVQDPPSIASITLDALTEAVPMSPIDFTANGGDPASYVWSATGALPAGLTLTQTTVGTDEVFTFSGTPSIGTAGTYTIDITVEDTSTTLTDALQVTLDVYPQPEVDTTAVPTTLPIATNTGTYSVTFASVGGTGAPPLQWGLGIVTGPDASLPGFNLTGETLSTTSAGTPTGVYTVEVILTDANGASDTVEYTLQINPVVELSPLPFAVTQAMYHETVEVVPDTGVGPFTFAVVTPFDALLNLTIDVSGPMPVISGTVPIGTEGEHTVDLNVTDANSVSSLVTVTLTVVNAMNGSSGCCAVADPTQSLSVGWLLLLLPLLTFVPLRLRRTA